MAHIRVAEFFSGIGGMHAALKLIPDLHYEVKVAVEINNFANVVYQHNFPDTPVHQGNIEALSAKRLVAFNANLWTMSPPCQPFTRTGKGEWSRDPRTKSLLHLLNTLSSLALTQRHSLPTFILLENVKGFEESDTRDFVVNTLHSIGYFTKEFLLRPTQFRIPNSRLRYYMLARLPSRDLGEGRSLQSEGRVEFSIPSCVTTSIENGEDEHCVPISQFLDAQSDPTRFLVPETILCKSGKIMDIVTPQSKKSNCFTKAYTQYAEGTGSVLFEGTDAERISAFDAHNLQLHPHTGSCPLLELKIRYFAPLEIAKIHHLPEAFSFPPSITLKQQYRLLGNGVNSLVIAKLLEVLLANDYFQPLE